MSGSDDPKPPPAGDPPLIQLDRLPSDYRIRLEPNLDPEERQHRRALAAADARLRRWKDGFQFFMAWGVMLVLGGVALYVIFTSSSPDDRRWAQSVVGALVGALAGYALGRKGQD